MRSKGDSQKQALLRDKMIKKGRKNSKSRYISKILSVLKPQMKLLDIGCGTAHIIQELATSKGRPLLVGLDVSPAMLKIADIHTAKFSNIGLVEGDGFKLPFPGCIFDIVITKLADYSPQEAYRVLRKNGYFFEYSLGPEADKEIKEFFPKRITKENFFFPRNLKEWKQEVCEHIREAGFAVSSVEDFKEDNYYDNEDELMDLIEMVPLVKDFDRETDRKKIKQLVEQYENEEGVKITWHYYIMIARKSWNKTEVSSTNHKNSSRKASETGPNL